LAAPFRHGARSARSQRQLSRIGDQLGAGFGRRWRWSRASSSRTAARIRHHPVPVGNREVPVTEEVALDLPFGKLLHFAKDVDTRSRAC
jgi:poly(3-hydroxybutyrate) depolymerase